MISNDTKSTHFPIFKGCTKTTHKIETRIFFAVQILATNVMELHFFRVSFQLPQSVKRFKRCRWVSGEIQKVFCRCGFEMKLFRKTEESVVFHRFQFKIEILIKTCDNALCVLFLFSLNASFARLVRVYFKENRINFYRLINHMSSVYLFIYVMCINFFYHQIAITCF